MILDVLLEKGKRAARAAIYSTALRDEKKPRVLSHETGGRYE